LELPIYRLEHPAMIRMLAPQINKPLYLGLLTRPVITPKTRSTWGDYIPEMNKVALWCVFLLNFLVGYVTPAVMIKNLLTSTQPFDLVWILYLFFPAVLLGLVARDTAKLLYYLLTDNFIPYGSTSKTR
jgi:hypothetical protein